MKFYYAVQKGRHPGVYETWEACQREVIGAAGSVYKKFKTRAEAEAFVKSKGYDTALPFDTTTAIDHRSAFAPSNPDVENASSSGTERASTPSRRAPSGPLFHSIDDVTTEDILLELENVRTEALAYVDGSFNIASGVYGYGGVLLCRNGSIVPLQGHGRDNTLRTMRNVAGEIHGAMAAIQAAADAGIRSITIFYDYMGIEMWANGQWKTNKEGTRAYKTFIDGIRPLINIQFRKVAAHTGVRFNELVDQLAKASVGINV